MLKLNSVVFIFVNLRTYPDSDAQNLMVPFAGLKLGWNWLKNTVPAELLWEKNTVPAEKRSRISRIWSKPNMANIFKSIHAQNIYGSQLYWKPHIHLFIYELQFIVFYLMSCRFPISHVCVDLCHLHFNRLRVQTTVQLFFYFNHNVLFLNSNLC